MGFYHSTGLLLCAEKKPLFVKIPLIMGKFCLWNKKAIVQGGWSTLVHCKLILLEILETLTHREWVSGRSALCNCAGIPVCSWSNNSVIFSHHFHCCYRQHWPPGLTLHFVSPVHIKAGVYVLSFAIYTLNNVQNCTLYKYRANMPLVTWHCSNMLKMGIAKMKKK